MRAGRTFALICAALLAAACLHRSESLVQTPTVDREWTTMDGKTVEPEIFGVHLLYPRTVPAAPKAPKGYRPCHLSHYGRHGARHIQYDTQYFFVHSVLEKAHADGKLTPEGERLRDRYEAIYPLIERRSGELCPLGQEQHRAIARRMVDNYPSLFRGDAEVIALSTNLERTMLSMQACIDELHARNPRLRIAADGARREMGYLNPHCVENPWGGAFDQMWKGTKAVWREKFNAQSEQWVDWEGFAARIFTDVAYAKSLCRIVNFERDVYLIAADVPCMPVESEGFFDFFTSEELLTLAKCGDNYLSYMEKGRSPECPGRCWALCHTLLEDFITKADRDLESGLGVRLRFGHDGCMMGMFVLMDLPGWNGTAGNPDEIWECWDCSRIPMASNIQMTLYRGRKADDPILMTWMLNEEPMPLPLEEVAPGFYRWEDFKEVYRPKIEAARQLLKETENL